jgi:hypothetical protein
MAYAVLTQPTYQPAVRVIVAITQSFPALVTTSFPHSYGVGMIVRLKVPNNFGMTQVNNLQGTIIATTDTTFNIDIDTSTFDPFVIPPDQPTGLNPTIMAQAQYAQVAPVGEVNTTLAFAWSNVLPY